MISKPAFLLPVAGAHPLRRRMLQVFAKPDAAGNGWLVIIDDDLETRVASLRTANISVDREIASESNSLAIVQDSDGNRIVFSMSRD